LLLNLGIIVFNEVKKPKLFVIALIVFAIFNIFTICVIMYYICFVIVVTEHELNNYFFHNYLFFVKFVFSTGNWLLPFIHFLWRCVKTARSGGHGNQFSKENRYDKTEGWEGKK
jgi:hypothetical protein